MSTFNMRFMNIFLLAYINVGISKSGLTSQDMIEIMSGTGPASLASDLNHMIHAWEFFAAFPQCLSCRAAQPCASIDSCFAPSLALDHQQSSEFHYCHGTTTCCIPELCAKPVHRCAFDPDIFLSTRLMMSIDTTLLREMEALASPYLQVEEMQVRSLKPYQ